MSTPIILTEAYKRTKRTTGVDTSTPMGVKQALYDPNVFKVYAASLAEGLSDESKQTFMTLAESTRVALMENSMFQLNPYESLSLPILRVFYPKLIAKELVNVMPIDKPDVVRGFIRAYFRRNLDTAGTYPNAFPSTSTDISKGPGVTIASPGTASVPGTENIFAQIGGGLTADTAHIEKDFQIVSVTDTTGNTADVSIIADVDGNFSASVTVADQTDVISGHINYEAGSFTISSLSGVVASVSYQAYASLEENRINPTVRFEIEKIRMTTVDRRISAEWTINMEQDAKALFDVQLQAELVNIIGEQIALDIDREIINALIATNAAQNPASHTKTFDLTPDTGFAWGRKIWYENVIPVLNTLSAQIYNSCLMGAANTLACNPLDAAVFESLNTFEYNGNSVDGGDVGYRSATVAGGKWKILVSSIVPAGKVITKYRSEDLARAAYVYAPYVPALLTPYPLGPVPSLTIMARYATKVIRPNAIGVLNIIDTENSYPA